MPQAVEFPVRNTVLFQELVKLPAWSLGVHDRAVPLREYPVVAFPGGAEFHLFEQVLLFQPLEQLDAGGVKRYRSRSAALRCFGSDRLALELVR